MWTWGVVLLVVEGGAPAEVLGRDLHGLGQLHLVSGEEPPPAFGGVVAQPGGVFTFQRVDERPDGSGVSGDLRHRFLQVGHGLGREQAVRARPLRDVLHVPVARLHIIRHHLHAITGSDVLCVVAGAATARFDVAALLDQARHFTPAPSDTSARPRRRAARLSP